MPRIRQDNDARYALRASFVDENGDVIQGDIITIGNTVWEQNGSDIYYNGGNVGIGTDSPNLHGWTKAVTLDTANNAGYELGQSGTKYGAFALQGDGRVQVTNFTANPLTFQTNNTERMRIAADGAVGIGTDSPNYSLDVVGAINATGNLTAPFLGLSASSASTNLVTNSGAALNLTNTSATDGNFSNIGGYNSNGLVTSQIDFINTSHSARTGEIAFFTHNGAGMPEAMRIDSAGRVGLGTDTPSAPLTVRQFSNNFGTYEHQSWTYDSETSGGEFDLKLKQVVEPNLVKYKFDLRNSGTTYVNNLVLDRGNVGVGTDTPSASLEIDTASCDIKLTSTSNTGELHLFQGYNSYIDANRSLYVTTGTNNAGKFAFTSSGRLGVGTESPFNKVDIKTSPTSTLASSESQLALRNGLGRATYVTFDNGGDLTVYNTANGDGSGGDTVFHQNTGEAVRIGNSGSVHVGPGANDSQNYTIDLSPDTQATAGIDISKASPNVNLDLYAGGSATNLGGWSGQIRFFTGGSNQLGIERMRLDSNGQLTIQGSTAAFNATPPKNGLQAYYETDTGIATLGSYSSGGSTALAFNVNFGGAASTEAARIDSASNFLVGTKTWGSISTRGCQLGAGGTGIFSNTSDVPIYLNRDNGDTSSQPLISFFRNQTQSGTISATQGGTPAFGAPSDIRLKDNVTDHESELANVMALRPVRWDWKDEARGSGEGFIAQELEQTEWSDLVSEFDGYKTVSGLGTVETRLIKAMQEAVTRIETLEAEVAALKGN